MIRSNMAAVKVPEYSQPMDDQTFIREIYSNRRPVVLKNFEFGDAKTVWTTDYLAKSIGSCPVKVHVSPTTKMDFLNKNFQYKTLAFNDFITRASRDLQSEYFLCPGEKYYLRSIASGNPRKDVADIRKDFQEIAKDIKMPSFISEENFFSSVLRIGSANLQLWTHYDVMDNVLLQIIGRKRVILFSPQEALNLYLDGDKSKIIDVDDPDLNLFPNFQNAIKHECILEAGDALFIPALWFHNVIPQDFSVGLNIFWRHLKKPLYDQSDIYGNKDPQPASSAMQMVDRTIKQLDKLPDDYKDFYARLMIAKLQKKCFLDNN